MNESWYYSINSRRCFNLKIEKLHSANIYIVDNIMIKDLLIN